MTLIRTGRLSDYQHIREYDEFIGDRRVDLQEGALYVADCATSVAVGYAKVSPNGFLGWPLVQYLCMRKDFRKRGIGANITKHIINDDRFVRLYSSTEKSNKAMLALFQRVGAEQVGHVDRLNVSKERELLFRLK